MFRKLVKTAEVEVEDRTYNIRYYELKTVRGVRRSVRRCSWVPAIASSWTTTR